MTEAQLEQELIDRGLTAVRLTPDDLDAVIVSASYFQPQGTTITVCLLTLKNGYIVTGESACASLENFDAKIGQVIALRNAREKVWTLEGYLLRQRLYEAGCAE